MIREILEKLKYKPAESLEQMKLWLSWYQGSVKDFHDYTIYNGTKTIKRKRDGMHMAKQICQDWASLIMNEKVDISSDNETFDEVLQSVFENNQFRFRANQLIELTFALGTGAFVEFIDNKEVQIDYVRGDCIFPLSWENGRITECAFASLRNIEGKETYYINAHVLDENDYVIYNHLVEKEGGKEIDLPEGLQKEVKTGSETPRFQIITPNIINNVNLDSPYGISVFANSISRLKKVDLIFDSGNNEFSLGKKRIIVPLSMAQTKVNDAMNKPIFDPNDVAFYALNLTDPESKTPIDLTGQLRIQEHSQGLQDALNYLSDGVGLGSGRYDYVSGGATVTATQVISEKSDLFQNLKKHELVIETALKEMCFVIAELSGIVDPGTISIRFDDSIITDRNTDIDNAIKLTSAGLKSKITALMETFNMSDKDAEEELERILLEQRALIAVTEDIFETEGDPSEEAET